MAVINKNGTYMALPSAIKRGSANALDTTSVWYDRALMEFYAQGGGKLDEVDVPVTAYVGQILTLVDEINKIATIYIIENVEGRLKEIGTAVFDNAQVEEIQNDIVELQAANITINEEIDEIKEQHNLLAVEVGTISSNYTTKFATVNTEITDLKAKDAAQDDRLNDLTNYIGVPADKTLALFPAVEGILTELENLKIEVGAGETNVIEGITINGETIQPNSAKLIAFPTFSGSKAGLVPAIIDTVSENAVLASNGSWLDVELLIDSKLNKALTWDTI